METITIEVADNSKVSDGYHTFAELYDHRIVLYITLCRFVAKQKLVWRSRKHSDGSKMPGWFVLGIAEIPGQQITYHLPESLWDETNFAETVEQAPQFDGHTSAGVLERLKVLIPTP